MAAGSIPIREELWGKRNIDIEVLCNSLKNVASHPKVITDRYSDTRSNLEFPLTWHNFSIGSGNIDASGKASSIVHIRDDPTKAYVGSN